jgi:hypothetical protein
MTECLMPRCDKEATESSGMCTCHHKLAHPGEAGMDYIAKHMRREHAMHPTTMAHAQAAHATKRGDLTVTEQGWLMLGKNVQIRVAKKDEATWQVLGFLAPEEPPDE